MAGNESAIAPVRTAVARRLGVGIRSFRLSQVWAAAAVVIPVLMIAGSPLDAVDLAYHLRAGNLMLNTHTILRTDIFTAPAYGRPWLDQQWLAQVVLADVFRHGGWFALAVLRALMSAGALGLVFLACRAAGAATRRAAWLTFASGIVIMPAFKLRPQLFGVLCFVAVAWLLARRATHPTGVWFALPITVLWANLHGSFVMAPLLIGLAWTEDRPLRKREASTLLLATVGSLLATLVNPYGYRVWSYAIDLATDPVVHARITEWQPPTVRTPMGVAFFLSVVLVACLLIATLPRPVAWRSLLPLAVFLAIALAAVRGVWWWGMIFPIVLGGVLSRPPTGQARPDPDGPMNAALIGILASALIAVLIRWAPYAGPAMPGEDRLEYAPSGITRELHHVLLPGEVVFNPQEWGSWLELQFPGNLMTVDSLIEVPAPDVWRKYADVSRAVEGWQATLDSWDVDVAVLARDEQSALIPRMRADPRWRLVYDDADGAIFRRN
jgi:hypothetical protein